MFTPQIGDSMPEILTREERLRAMNELLDLRVRYPKVDMAKGLIEQFATPPHSPEDCVFARTTQVLTADLKTKVTPCQYGGKPDCEQCGCIATMGLAAVAAHKLGGVVPVGLIFRSSIAIGETWRKWTEAEEVREPEPALKVLQ